MKTTLEYTLDLMFPKPSELMRWSKFRHKQIRGRYTDYNNGYCAIGALFKGLGWDGETPISDDLAKSVEPLVTYFEKHFGNGISYFNDHEGKSFDWFAEKFEEIGY